MCLIIGRSEGSHVTLTLVKQSLCGLYCPAPCSLPLTCTPSLFGTLEGQAVQWLLPTPEGTSQRKAGYAVKLSSATHLQTH